MSDTSRAEWSKRVQRWKDSGLTAKESPAEVGLNASTLSYWKWRLKSEGTVRSGASARGASSRKGRRSNSSPASKPRFVEVSAAVTACRPIELVLAGGAVVASRRASTRRRLRAWLGCLLPEWPKSRILELAPCNRKQTRQKPEAQQLLADNIWLVALREIDAFHAQTA